jgi:putative methyltransferase (TIGR04325 family)
MADHNRAKQIVRAVTPPIVLLAVKKALVRLGLRHVPPVGFEPDGARAMQPAPAAVEPEVPTPLTSPPEWEFVPEGWERETPGWDAGTVAEAYLAKWPEWLEALRGDGPLGVYHEARVGEPIGRDDVAAHNMLLSFAYVLARAAHERDRISVLDWGGGLGHYAVLARAVLPEVELDWHCREVPSIAEAGTSVNREVTFHSDATCLDATYDLVFASGSLQYAPDWQELLGRLAGATTGFLYVTRLPIALSAPSFVVLQRAHAYGYATEYIGWVISRKELLAAASGAHLELDRELLLAAWFSAEGAPEEPIGHRGFLFRPARSSANSG